MNGENKDILRVEPEVGKAVLFYNQLRKSQENAVPAVQPFVSQHDLHKHQRMEITMNDHSMLLFRSLTGKNGSVSPNSDLQEYFADDSSFYLTAFH